MRVERAGKTFGTVRALDDCTFTVARGHEPGFLGPNGAGEATTMRAIFGLVVDAGEIVWDEPTEMECRPE